MKAAIDDADQSTMDGDNRAKYKDIVFGLTAGAGARVRLAGNLHLTGGLRFNGNYKKRSPGDRFLYYKTRIEN